MSTRCTRCPFVTYAQRNGHEISQTRNLTTYERTSQGHTHVFKVLLDIVRCSIRRDPLNNYAVIVNLCGLRTRGTPQTWIIHRISLRKAAAVDARHTTPPPHRDDLSRRTPPFLLLKVAKPQVGNEEDDTVHQVSNRVPEAHKHMHDEEEMNCQFARRGSPAHPT